MEKEPANAHPSLVTTGKNLKTEPGWRISDYRINRYTRYKTQKIIACYL